MDLEVTEFVAGYDIGRRKSLELNELANTFEKEVFLQDERGRRVSAKSLLGVMSLGLTGGKQYQFCVSKNSPDTERMIARLLELVGGEKCG